MPGGVRGTRVHRRLQQCHSQKLQLGTVKFAVHRQVPELLHTFATSSASAKSAMVARAAANSCAASALAAVRRSSSALISCTPCTSNT
jgi:hypothetical protein